MLKKTRESAAGIAAEDRLLTVRRNAVSMAVTAALTGAMAMPSVALAQDEGASDDDEYIEEIITYGKFRQSLLSSIDAKRNDSSIIEAISAEDIGKLPDVSIAESLARLPGLTVQRLNGRGQVVNLRGMSPDFSTGLLNGREQVSVGDNRGVEFDQYPSELLQQVIVYKTPDAALIGQGLSGTIDMRTVRPLEYGDRALNLNARYVETEYDLIDNRDDSGERFSATYIDQFADDTVGLVLGFAHTTTPNFGRNNNTWGYYVDAGAGAVAVGGGRVWARASELERNSFTVGLDFKPSDQLSIEFDGFISDFEEDQTRNGLVLGSLNNVTATDTVEFLPGVPVATAGSYSDSLLAVENNLLLRDAEMQSFGANIEYRFDNAWILNVDLSHSSIDRSDTDFETTSAAGGAGGMNDIVDFQSGGGGTVWGVGRDYTNVDYNSADAIYATSPYGWGDGNALAPYVPAGQFGYNKVFTVNDDINAFRAEMERELEWGGITGVEFGYNYTNREKDRVSDEGVITSGLIDPGTGLLAEQTEIVGASVADLGWGMFGGNTSIVTFDPLAMLAAGQIQQGDYLYDDILAKAWVVEEDVHSAYVKFDVDMMLGDMPLSGNFGLQYQWWDQESAGANAFGSGTSLVSDPLFGEDDDGELLPSLNLSLEVTDNQKIRFGYATTLSRPRMDEMRASGFYQYDESTINPVTGQLWTQADVDAAIAAGVPEITAYDQLSPWSRDGGNVFVKPWIADAIDLSYEYYLDDGYGMFSLGYFYKDLDTYVFNQTLLFDFSDLNPNSALTTDITTGVSSSPENGEGGTVEGWEVAGSLDFGIFTPTLEGFGVVGNYADNTSDIEPNGPGSGSRLPGLSDTVWNITAYYERGGFSARINKRYRDGYVGEVAGFGGARTGSDIEEESIIDAQMSYSFDTGRFSGLSITAQALNLDDEPFRTTHANVNLPNEYQTFGTTYTLGVSYAVW